MNRVQILVQNKFLSVIPESLGQQIFLKQPQIQNKLCPTLIYVSLCFADKTAVNIFACFDCTKSQLLRTPAAFVDFFFLYFFLVARFGKNDVYVNEGTILQANEVLKYHLEILLSEDVYYLSYYQFLVLQCLQTFVSQSINDDLCNANN